MSSPISGPHVLMNCVERLVEFSARLSTIHASHFIAFPVFHVTYRFFIFASTSGFLLHPHLTSNFSALFLIRRFSSTTGMLSSHPEAGGFMIGSH